MTCARPPEQRGARSIEHMAPVLSLVLLVAGVVLMLAIHVVVVCWALRRGVDRRAARDEELGAVDKPAEGLPAGELEKLPCYDYKQGGGEGGCAVCLEGYEVGERCRRLPRCGHSFHAQCVDSWLRKSLVCPVCRTEAAGDWRGAGEDDKQAAAAAPAPAVEMSEMRSSQLSPLQVMSER